MPTDEPPENACPSCGAPLAADAAAETLCAACEQGATAEFTEEAAARTPVAVAASSFTLPPTRAERAVQAIGDFEVIGKLGQGGMGAVYRARQMSLDREVALKVLPAHFEEDADYVGRFQREAKVAASLNHPNLVRVYASGVADGSHYIAMELVEGENLRQRLKRGRMEPVEALRICADVARGLQCGWQRAQLIHRDIKPSNIYLSHAGEVKLGDLGLAKSLSENTSGLTQTGTAMGTPHYMSPEQIRGDRSLDFRADIYSLGCTLYEMLIGQPPYHGSDGMSIMRHHLDSPPPALLKVWPQCPIPLVRLVGKMVKKNRVERFGSYEDLIAELDWMREQIDASGATSFMATRAGSGRIALPPQPAAASTRVPQVASSSPPSSSKKRPLLWAKVAAAVVVVGGAAILIGTLKAPKGKLPARAAARTDTPSTAEPAAGGAIEGRSIWSKVDLSTFDSATPDGKLEVKAGPIWRPMPNRFFESVAARVSFAWQEDRPGVTLRVGGATQYFAKLVGASTGDYAVGLGRFVGGDVMIRNFRLPRRLSAGDRVEFQFAKIGRSLFTWVDGDFVGSVSDVPVIANGALGVTSQQVTIDSYEYLPLDDFSEAEALKLLGVPARAEDQAAPSPAAATKDAPFVNSLGMKFVPVPITGGPTDGKRVLFSVWETRVQDYEAFVKETGREWPRPDFKQGPAHPAVGVSWEDADAFCAWLTQHELKGGGLPAKHRYRLPSDHEWSCAVGIGARERATENPVEKSGQIPDLYPWGTSWPPPAQAGNFAGEELAAEVQSGHPWIKTVLAGYSDGYPRTAPVASFPASELGIFDLAGNVWEWCQDRSGKDEMRVIRGGSWELSARTGLLLSERYYGSPVNRVSYRGFRVVLAPAE